MLLPSSLDVRSQRAGTDVPLSLCELEQDSAMSRPGVIHKGRILSVGNDPALVNSRQLVLQSAGHNVVSIASSAALSMDLLRQFDLVVLCHTIKSRDEIVQSIRGISPDLPILLLDEICCDPGQPGEVHVSPKPEILLGAVENLLRRQSVVT